MKFIKHKEEGTKRKRKKGQEVRKKEEKTEGRK